MAVRKAEAVWKGNLKDGSGRMKLGSGAFEGAYSFSSRFEEGSGTNPEELIGAAHAGCFSMALSGDLGKAGFTPDGIHTTATVTLGKMNDKTRITKIHLKVSAKVSGGITSEQFLALAEGTKTECPVSAALSGVEITLDANLVE
jgi:osmotically inducible protein OsmC